MEIKIEVPELKDIVLKHFKDSGYIVSENRFDVKIIYEDITVAGKIFNKTKNILSGVSVKIEGIKQNENE
ncbi:MAG: hypothetical protein RIR48_1542 [Bacteroidota bacterium]|jgi:hypothetical protein